MQRRDFLALTGLTAGGLIVPSFFGKAIAAEQLQSTLDLGLKKRLADAALAAARQAGATYCDVRIGRYLRQFVITREDKVQNVVNTESTGVGIRVIVNGAWGFAATNALGTADVAKAAQQAAAIAKANAGVQTAPVQLAKAPGVAEVASIGGFVQQYQVTVDPNRLKSYDLAIMQVSQAVQRLRPDAKLGIGPPITDGFYYDFRTEPLTPDDLVVLEKDMARIVKERQRFVRRVVTDEGASAELASEPGRG